MKKARLIGIFLLFGSLLLGALLIYNESTPPSYIKFAFFKSNKFYAKFADGCQSIRDNLAANTNKYKIQGNDIRLPAFIKSLHPTYIMASSNYIQVVFGDSYGVVWHQDEMDSNFWRLTIFGDAAPRQLYSIYKDVTGVKP